MVISEVRDTSNVSRSIFTSIANCPGAPLRKRDFRYPQSYIYNDFYTLAVRFYNEHFSNEILFVLIVYKICNKKISFMIVSENFVRNL